MQQALNQMAPLTVLGPNGMSPIFYKSFLHIVAEDITIVVLWALNLGIVLDSINTTLVSLITIIKKSKESLGF